MLTDAELLRRYAADRSESAFAELVRRHLDGVYSSALRRVGFDTHLAQDVAQAVFIALARQSRALANHPFLTAWLYTTTRNEAASTVRRERRRKTREAAASAMNEINASASSALNTTTDWSRLSPILDDTIDQLSETDRAAILLRFIAQKPFAEIGAQLRLSEDAARMRVDRALDKLRTLLARRGLTSTSAALTLLLANNALATAPAAVATTIVGSVLALPPVPLALPLLNLMTAHPIVATTVVLASLCAALVIPVTRTYSAAAASTIAPTSHPATPRTPSAAPTLIASTTITTSSSTTGPAQPTSTASSLLTSASQTRAPAAAPHTEDPAVFAGREFLLRHPEVVTDLIAWANAQTDFKYLPLYRELQLSPAQIERFRSLLRENLHFSLPHRSSEPHLRLPAGSGLEMRTIQAALRELLGPAGFQAFQKHRRELSVRESTIAIAAALTTTDQPLSAVQIDTLQRTILAHTDFKRTFLQQDWGKVQTALTGQLSASALSVIAQLKAQSEYNLALNEAMPKSSPLPAGKTVMATVSSAPRLQNLQLAANRATTEVEYQDFLRHAALSPTQTEAFFATKAQFNEDALDVIAIRNSPDRPQQPAGFLNQSYQQETATLNTLLGPALLKNLRQYERTQPARLLVKAFAGLAATEQMPLTVSQIDQLTQSIVTQSTNFANGGSVELNSLDWKLIDQAAANRLTSQQAGLFRTVANGGSNSRFNAQVAQAIAESRKRGGD
ncbi:hypothetical protein CMV30_16215 [Nibricoccus aquaticus]|uniref:RNA polymerase sigma-70 region 2 domain-containing protein n=1 Tax=Nibricoccus aquaticus TaxID=2576891 RepID=A0A290QMI3_9BACT|nr:RNA polymerase sigma factor [Nibricoccus aquaticus]ATC65362.1 hypothetical protein CMV30_16215 [Nibricoccus aquaticus]